MDKIYKVVDGNDVTVYNYYENDKLSSVTVPGGTTTSYTYDEEGNLLTLTNTKSDGTVLDSFTYTYSDDTLGVKNQISKTETVGGVLKGTTSYEYDGLGRLTKVVTPDGVQNVYTYDGAGNRLTKTSTAGEESAVTEYTYDEQNRLLNTSAYVTGGTDEVNTYYGYDNNGNQISRWTQTEKTSGTEDAVTLSELGINAADETAVYEYDVFNRLTAIYQGDTIIENTYDGAGDNISRVEDGVPVYHVYDGNTVILELDGNGAEKARNVYGRNLIARESDGEKAIYRYNGHGDVIALNAPNGDMIAEYAYDEFGQVIEEQAAPQATPMVDIDFSVEGSEEYDFPEDSIFDNPYRYAGYEYLDEVELYDLNARYYDPSIARFLTEDPYYNLGNRVMGVYEINVPNVYSIMQANVLYAYCGNNPVMFVDPLGLTGFVFDENGNVVSYFYDDYVEDVNDNSFNDSPFIDYDEDARYGYTRTFNTIDEAAADFGQNYGELSINMEEELASVIYKMDGGGYYYDKPRNDLLTHEERAVSFFISFDINNTDERVAIIHTHGAYDADTQNEKDAFSYPGNSLSEYSDTVESNNSGLDYYLVSPAGNLRKYISNSNDYEGILIRTDMPVDPSISIYKKYYGTSTWSHYKELYPQATNNEIVKMIRRTLGK